MTFLSRIMSSLGSVLEGILSSRFEKVSLVSKIDGFDDLIVVVDPGKLVVDVVLSVVVLARALVIEAPRGASLRVTGARIERGGCFVRWLDVLVAGRRSEVPLRGLVVGDEVVLKLRKSSLPRAFVRVFRLTPSDGSPVRLASEESGHGG